MINQSSGSCLNLKIFFSISSGESSSSSSSFSSSSSSSSDPEPDDDLPRDSSSSLSLSLPLSWGREGCFSSFLMRCDFIGFAGEDAGSSLGLVWEGVWGGMSYHFRLID